MAFEQLVRNPKVIPSTVSGTQNDLALGLRVDSIIEWTGSSDLTITGIAGGVAGSVFTFKNNGVANVFFNYLDAGSSGNNRFNNIITSGPTVISIGGYITFFHNGTRWQLIECEQGIWITVPFAAGNFTASGAMTWTVGAGNIITQAYKIVGNTIHYSINLANPVIGGTLDVELRVALPSTYICQNTITVPCIVVDPGIPVGFSSSGPVSGQTYIRIFSNLTGTNWHAGNSFFLGFMTFPLI